MTETSNREVPVIIVTPSGRGDLRYEGTWESDDAGRLMITGADGRMLAMYAPSAWLLARDASADVEREQKALARAKQALAEISRRSGREPVIKNVADEALHDIADIEAQP